MKLTKPQIEFLKDCAHERGSSCTQAYRPAKALAARGLITTDHHIPSHYSTTNWWKCSITEAGRSALAALSQ